MAFPYLPIEPWIYCERCYLVMVPAPRGPRVTLRWPFSHGLKYTCLRPTGHGGWSCWLPCGLTGRHSDVTVASWCNPVPPAGRGNLFCSPWFSDPGAYTPTSLTSRSSLVWIRQKMVPQFWGLCPRSPDPLGCAVSVPVLKLAPLALGLWFKESCAQCHDLLGNWRKQPRLLRAALSCPLANPTNHIATQLGSLRT